MTATRIRSKALFYVPLFLLASHFMVQSAKSQDGAPQRPGPQADLLFRYTAFELPPLPDPICEPTGKVLRCAGKNLWNTTRLRWVSDGRKVREEGGAKRIEFPYVAATNGRDLKRLAQGSQCKDRLILSVEDDPPAPKPGVPPCFPLSARLTAHRMEVLSSNASADESRGENVMARATLYIGKDGRELYEKIGNRGAAKDKGMRYSGYGITIAQDAPFGSFPKMERLGADSYWIPEQPRSSGVFFELHLNHNTGKD